ncbi:MAG: hypothetical protein PHX14_12810 [Syntrophomonadaceae bacterium]|nr:hypothetical protein [Syntrophomonadaceae bacterium]
MKAIRKMDEMEMSINLKCIRIAWVFGLMYLLVWVICEFLITKNLPALPFILLTSQVSVYFACQLIITRMTVGKNEK